VEAARFANAVGAMSVHIGATTGIRSARDPRLDRRPIAAPPSLLTVAFGRDLRSRSLCVTEPRPPGSRLSRLRLKARREEGHLAAADGLILYLRETSESEAQERTVLRA
jgi:hypothetical protein